MKKILLIIFIITGFSAKSQIIFEKEFQHSLIFNISEISALPGGDIFLTAYANPATYDSSIAILIKTDSLLNIKWSKRYKLLHQDFLNCISPLSDGNYLIGGAGKENFNQSSGGSLYKIDTAGTVLWNWIYSDAYDDAVLNVFEQQNNSLMLFIRDGVSNHPTKVVLTASDGTMISQRIFNKGFNNLFADAVASDGSGNYLMTGTINNTAGSPVLYILSLNDNGINWYKEYDFNRTITCTDIEKLSDGNFAISGSMTDSIASTTYNCYVLKINAAGDVIWNKEIKQSLAYNEYGLGIVALTNAEIILFGHASTANGFNALACKLNSTGDVIWAGAYGNYSYQAFNHALPFQDGRFLFEAFINASDKSYFVLTDVNGVSPCNYFAATFLSENISVIDSFHNLTVGTPTINPYSPAFLIASEIISLNTLCSSTSVFPNPHKAGGIAIYPNPSNGNFQIDFTSEKITDAKIEIINVFGEKTDEKNVALKEGNNSFSINESDLAAGMYLVRIQSEFFSVHTKMILIK